MKRFLLAALVALPTVASAQPILFEQADHSQYVAYGSKGPVGESLSWAWLGSSLSMSALSPSGLISGFGFWLQNTQDVTATGTLQFEVWRADFGGVANDFTNRLRDVSVTYSLDAAAGAWVNAFFDTPIDPTGYSGLAFWTFQTEGTGVLNMGAASTFTSSQPRNISILRIAPRWRYPGSDETVANGANPAIRVYGVAEPAAFTLLAVAVPFGLLVGYRHRRTHQQSQCA